MSVTEPNRKKLHDQLDRILDSRDKDAKRAVIIMLEIAARVLDKAEGGLEEGGDE